MHRRPRGTLQSTLGDTDDQEEVEPASKGQKMKKWYITRTLTEEWEVTADTVEAATAAIQLDVDAEKAGQMTGRVMNATLASRVAEYIVEAVVDPDAPEKQNPQTPPSPGASLA